MLLREVVLMSGDLETFPLDFQFRPVMTKPAEAAKNTVAVGRKHILDQQLRIGRQRELIAKLERDGHADLVAKALRLLAEMEQMLGTMEADYAAAQERLSQASVDEPASRRSSATRPDRVGLAALQAFPQQLPQASGRAESGRLR